MNKKCLNCNATVTGKYCSTCGQAADTHRINWHFLLHDLQHGILHIDKGIFFTLKELFTRPGNSIREYVSGKRVRHFKPFSMILILAGIYGFITHYLHINILANNIQITGDGEQAIKFKASVEQATEWMQNHYAILSLLQIPVFACATYICFKKSGYNYMEHVVINTFLTAQKLFIHIAAMPIYYLTNNTDSLRPASRIIDITGFIIFILSLMQLFNQFSLFQRFIRSWLTLMITFGFLFILILILFRYFSSNI